MGPEVLVPLVELVELGHVLGVERLNGLPPLLRPEVPLEALLVPSKRQRKVRVRERERERERERVGPKGSEKKREKD